MRFLTSKSGSARLMSLHERLSPLVVPIFYSMQNLKPASWLERDSGQPSLHVGKWALVGPAGFEPTTFTRNSALAPLLRVSLTAPEPLHPFLRSVNPLTTFWSPSSYLPRLRPHFLPENVMDDFEYMRFSLDPRNARS